MRCQCSIGEPGAPGACTGPGARNGGWAARVRGAVAWGAPVVTLALLPKCPLCLAAYAALYAGVRLSAATASGLREAMIGVSVAALVALGVRAVWRRGWAG